MVRKLTLNKGDIFLWPPFNWLSWATGTDLRFTLKISENLLKGLTFIDIGTGNCGESIFFEFWFLTKWEKFWITIENFEFIPFSPLQTDQSSPIIDEKKEVTTGDSLLVFINFKVKAFLYLGLFSHCLENWTKYNPTKLHQLNNGNHQPKLYCEAKTFPEKQNIFWKLEIFLKERVQNTLVVVGWWPCRDRLLRLVLLCLSVMLSISLDLITTPLWTVHCTFLQSIIPVQNLDEIQWMKINPIIFLFAFLCW